MVEDHGRIFDGFGTVVGSIDYSLKLDYDGEPFLTLEIHNVGLKQKSCRLFFGLCGPTKEFHHLQGQGFGTATDHHEMKISLLWQDVSWTSKPFLEYCQRGIPIHVLAEIYPDIESMPKSVRNKMAECQAKLAIMKTKCAASETRNKGLRLSYDELEAQLFQSEADCARLMVDKTELEQSITELSSYSDDLEKQLEKAYSSACFGVENLV
eukprot:TRINITY_DN2021_c0_g2_i1.p1 TRINITY_DN2021_c0_g2~~TRINITY_DN2021_c0_g2_i1.p1  ORF type:complete len:210 (-),score=22.48 TRINITY_DN2021_c0_g2_i1:132-761(-)